MEDARQLATQLNGDDITKARAAAESLSMLAEEAAPAAVALVKAADHDDGELREYAVAALEELGPPRASDQTELAKLLAADQADCAYWAATLLGRMEEGAADSAGSLTAILADSARPMNVRQRCAWAIGKIGVGGEAVAAALKEAASSDDERLARLAKEALEATAGS